MDYEGLTRRPRALFTGEEYAVVTGTPWATRAAVEVLAGGGNACDAAVAALLVVNVTHGVAASFPGVATMYYEAESGRVRSYIGAGTGPAAATIERFRERGFETVPFFDIWAQLVPASPDVLVALLVDCGSRSFARLAAPAIEIAREGFPTYAILVGNLELSLLERLGLSFRLPYNAEVFLGGEWWRPLHLHERLRFPDLADLAAAERSAIAAGGCRREGLQAVRDHFYKGPIARAIAELHRRRGGLMTENDLATYEGGWEEPVAGSYGEHTFHTNGPWSQGLVVPLALQIL